MNPLDRITQLTEENRQLLRSVDELRAQVETARQELARDSATIAKLAKDKQELVSALNACHSTLSARGGPCWHEIKEARALASNTLSRHA